MALDLDKIQALIKFVAKSGVSEVALETDEFKINIKSGPDKVVEKIVGHAPVEQPVQIVAATPSAPAPATEKPVKKKAKPEDDESNYVVIKSPMIGTFYRSPSPEKPTFVNVGDRIEPGKVVCIVEAMKLFNEIESEISGTIVKVLVDDTKPIEYDQPLFLVDPS